MHPSSTVDLLCGLGEEESLTQVGVGEGGIKEGFPEEVASRWNRVAEQELGR